MYGQFRNMQAACGFAGPDGKRGKPDGFPRFPQALGKLLAEFPTNPHALRRLSFIFLCYFT